MRIEFQEKLEEYRNSSTDIDKVLNAVSIRENSGTWFCKEVAERIAANDIEEDGGLDRLIINRERRVKGNRRKIGNPAYIYDKKNRIHYYKLTYRWETVKTFAKELRKERQSMADALWNDIVYTDVLQSDGFVIDYAVCTTYSLDMPSLLSVPFMLGTMTDLTETAMHSPHLILETINQSAGKFAVFCNAGCMVVPQANSKVYSLLEQSIVQVTLQAKGGGFVNFHPKVWIIKETNPDTDAQQIKLIVLSRNLTGSNDLDVVCELIGKIGTKPATRKAQVKHTPLVDFLTWLIAKAGNRTIRKNMHSICKDIDYIERFDLTDSPFEDYEFFPMGIPGYDGYTKCFEQSMLNHAAEMFGHFSFLGQEYLETDGQL